MYVSARPARSPSAMWCAPRGARWPPSAACPPPPRPTTARPPGCVTCGSRSRRPSRASSTTRRFFSGAIDATYIGPNPAINGWAKSNGTGLKIIAGSTSGGAGLVVKEGINTAADLKGKKIATPQLGNTQDVALRYWLKQNGLNADQHPATVKKLLQGHLKALDYIKTDEAGAKKATNDQIAALSGKALKDDVLNAAFQNLTFTADPIPASLYASAKHAEEVGLLKPVDLKGIYDLGPLNELLKASGQPEITDATAP